MNDINVKSIVRFGIGLTTSAAVIHGILWLVLSGFEARLPKAEIVRHPRFSVTHPPAEEIYRPQRRLLERTEWIDRTAGVVRIPIDRAIELLAEESK